MSSVSPRPAAAVASAWMALFMLPPPMLPPETSMYFPLPLSPSLARASLRLSPPEKAEDTGMPSGQSFSRGMP